MRLSAFGVPDALKERGIERILPRSDAWPLPSAEQVEQLRKEKEEQQAADRERRRAEEQARLERKYARGLGELLTTAYTMRDSTFACRRPVPQSSVIDSGRS